MSLSSDQATQAAVFLTIYKEAIGTLQQSVRRDSANQAIEDFTSRILRISKSKLFDRICDPRDSLELQQKDPRYRTIVRDVRSFQFSHYLFLKYLPQFLTFQGNSKELIQYM